MAKFSKTQVDKLGDRLRVGSSTETDLRQLDLYRRSFAGAYDEIVGRIRDELRLEPTGRPAKSTSSIVEKLQRESVRLSQIQDIAGCRILLDDITAQNGTVEFLMQLFPSGKTIDRRTNPSHGYRAVHVVVGVDNKLIEIQVRTLLQHLWAELSEKLSDVLGPTVKYGRGDPSVRSLLDSASSLVAEVEELEREASSNSAENHEAQAMVRELNERARDALRDLAALWSSGKGT